MIPEEKIKITERFTKELWPLNKRGSPDRGLHEIIYAIDEDMAFSGGPVTFDLVLAKYKEYLGYIKSMNSNRDPRYHSQTEEIHLFIQKKMYNEDFIPSSNSEIDRYLYGD
jgi:hypothetical protein